MKVFLCLIVLSISLASVSAQSLDGNSIKFGEEKVGLLTILEGNRKINVQLYRDVTWREWSQIQALLYSSYPNKLFKFSFSYTSYPSDLQTAGRLMYQAGEERSKALNLRLLSGISGLTSVAIISVAPGGAIACGIAAVIVQVAAINKENKANRLMRDAGATLQ